MIVCPVQEENMRLKKANRRLKETIVTLQNKVTELMQNFGKDKDKNERQPE